MQTLEKLISTHGIDVLEHLDRQVTIPVLATAQRQGDVFVLPITTGEAKTVVPTTGTPVVRGENGGNTHAIVGDGEVFVDVVTNPSARDLRVATLLVKEGSTAYLTHPEHGYLGIAPGVYHIRRQREQAEELRIVAD